MGIFSGMLHWRNIMLMTCVGHLLSPHVHVALEEKSVGGGLRGYRMQHLGLLPSTIRVFEVEQHLKLRQIERSNTV
jgi:hypothetical protein